MYTKNKALGKKPIYAVPVTFGYDPDVEFWEDEVDADRIVISTSSMRGCMLVERSELEQVVRALRLGDMPELQKVAEYVRRAEALVGRMQPDEYEGEYRELVANLAGALRGEPELPRKRGAAVIAVPRSHPDEEGVEFVRMSNGNWTSGRSMVEGDNLFARNYRVVEVLS